MMASTKRINEEEFLYWSLLESKSSLIDCNKRFTEKFMDYVADREGQLVELSRAKERVEELELELAEMKRSKNDFESMCETKGQQIQGLLRDIEVLKTNENRYDVTVKVRDRQLECLIKKLKTKAKEVSDLGKRCAELEVQVNGDGAEDRRLLNELSRSEEVVEELKLKAREEVLESREKIRSQQELMSKTTEVKDLSERCAQQEVQDNGSGAELEELSLLKGRVKELELELSQTKHLKDSYEVKCQLKDHQMKGYLKEMEFLKNNRVILKSREEELVLKITEVNDLSKRYAELEQQVMGYDSENRRLLEELSRSKGRVEVLESREKTADQQVLRTELNAIRSSFEVKLEESIASIARVISERRDIDSENKSMKTELEDMKAQCDSLQAKTQLMMTEIMDFDKIKLKNKERMNELELELNEMKRSKNDFESMCETKGQQIHEFLKEIEVLKNNENRYEVIVKARDHELECLIKKTAEQQVLIDEHNSSRSQLEAQLEDGRRDINSEIKLLKNETECLIKKRAEMNVVIDRLNTCCSELEDRHRDIDSENKLLRNELKDMKAQCDSLQAKTQLMMTEIMDFDKIKLKNEDQIKTMSEELKELRNCLEEMDRQKQKLSDEWKEREHSMANEWREKECLFETQLSDMTSRLASTSDENQKLLEQNTRIETKTDRQELLKRLNDYYKYCK